MKTHLTKLLKIRGFTLVELMVVIAIIGLLTGIVMTSLTGSKAKSRDAKRISDIGTIQLALELYFDRCKVYPSGLIISANNGLDGDICPSGITLGSFISVIPTPPAGRGQTVYDYAKAAYDSSNTNVVDYVIHAQLESYNEVMKDSLPNVPTQVTDLYWYYNTGHKAVITDFLCTNAVNTTDYCRTSK